MSAYNPYQPPTANDRAALDALDDSELFLRTLPKPIVKITGTSALVLGILVLFLGLRLVLFTRGTIAHVLQASHFALGVLVIVASIGVFKGSVARAVIGFAATPFALVVCALAALTGSLGGVFGAVLALLTLTLLVVSFGDVKRMGEARRVLAAR